MPANPTLHPTPPTTPLALRPREAAAAIGVCERTLWQWTKTGDVPHVRRGNTILYPVDLLRQWLEQQATATTTEGGGK